MDSRYARGKIYKITSGRTDRVYIGSTTLPLNIRLSSHYSDIKRSINISSKEILKYDDATIILIEDYPCKCNTELLTRERFYIETLPNVINIRVPTRSSKEYHQDNRERRNEYSKKYCQDNKEHLNKKGREYHHNNKEHRNEYSKKYHQDNKESINKKQREKFNCGCGGKYTRSYKSAHLKTKKHTDYINALENES